MFLLTVVHTFTSSSLFLTIYLSRLPNTFIEAVMSINVLHYCFFWRESQLSSARPQRRVSGTLICFLRGLQCRKQSHWGQTYSGQASVYQDKINTQFKVLNLGFRQSYRAQTTRKLRLACCNGETIK